ncbi:helix-turn-helix transcriptional regulator [Paenibacillus sp. J5C_2022]|uniref:helix-turn-helix transcriptional regulator n=1 Tax=Paenibacillus sp. J5C2022 TaxID=2977129 RepID=UPI0021CECD52|nr:helix-turn-helix transcriptional regulator [Paenibacillus sp. J5C2022]MCU6707739.1 helix-turn-helix transcriptional regulator [Paenibacillus sp. J5C2022]
MDIDRLSRQLRQLENSAPTSHAYREKAIALLRKSLPFQAACCTAVDPLTLLSIGALTEEGIEAIHDQLFRLEYHIAQHDFNRLPTLMHSDQPAASLFEATGGQPERSERYRDVLQPAGFADELRAALVSDGACWGFLMLFRRNGHPRFHQDEAAAIARIAPVLGETLRKFTLALPDDHESLEGDADSTGILILSQQLRQLSCNAAAADLLPQLRQWEHIQGDAWPRPIRAVAAMALAGKADNSSARQAQVCMRTPRGAYLSLQASRLINGTGAIEVAVLLEQARPAHMLPLIARAYGLTEREVEVMKQVFQGQSTKDIAVGLHLSPYTVQDHLKSIFHKTKVNSRRELVRQLLTRFIRQ